MYLYSFCTCTVQQGSVLHFVYNYDYSRAVIVHERFHNVANHFFFSFFHFTLPSIKISFCVTVFLSPIIFFFFSVFCSFFFFSRSCSEWKTTEVEMTDWKSSIRRIIWHTSRWECTITMNNRERWVENSLLTTHSVPNTWFVPENEKKIRTEENSIKYHFLYIDARNTWILLRSTTRSIS